MKNHVEYKTENEKRIDEREEIKEDNEGGDKTITSDNNVMGDVGKTNKELIRNKIEIIFTYFSLSILHFFFFIF